MSQIGHVDHAESSHIVVHGDLAGEYHFFINENSVERAIAESESLDIPKCIQNHNSKILRFQSFSKLGTNAGTTDQIPSFMNYVRLQLKQIRSKEHFKNTRVNGTLMIR